MAADAVKLLFFSSSLPFSFILSRLVHPSVLWWEGEAVAAAAWQAGQVAAAGHDGWMGRVGEMASVVCSYCSHFLPPPLWGGARDGDVPGSLSAMGMFRP